jgi:glutaredoxin
VTSYEIYIAGQPSCQQCRSSRRYLTRNNVPYMWTQFKDDKTAQELAAEHGYSTAPVCYVADRRTGRVYDSWAGFNTFRLHQWVDNYKAGE